MTYNSLTARIRKIRAAAFTVLALVFSLSSCNTIDDDYSECAITYEVRFRYDYNMKWADAFGHEVHAVALYAFDDEGKLVHTVTDTGEHLAKSGYTMEVDFNPADYDIIVWAGEPRSSSFDIPQEPATTKELVCAMHVRHITDHDEDYIVEDINLTPLWHGETVHPQPVIEGRRHITDVSLVKDTNTIRVIIQQMDDKEIDPEDFDFVITTHNCHIDAHNKVLREHKLRCRPYFHGHGTTEGSTGQMLNVLVAQITTARLMADSDAELVIYNKHSRETKLSIPLVKYLLLTEAEGHNIPAQEYLDRQDEYNMTFFLDKNMEWIRTHIVINDWIVRFNDIKH